MPVMQSGPRYSGLLTDLYELTMAAGYVQNRVQARATFELFARHLPAHRNYLVAAGLDQALEFLESVRFSSEDVAYLRALPLFRHVGAEFFDYLRDFKFSGDVWAMPEGTIFFPPAPLLRVTADIADAQLMETSLLSIVHLQTVIASKAARVASAAAGRAAVEFGSRRAHGVEAGVLAARAAFVGGCQGTSNTYAGLRFGIPVFGTQAHSWIMAHDQEAAAFSNFLDVFPEHATLLVDTYDVRAAIENIIAQRRKPSGIRLDSGDVLADSIWARKRFDSIGWNDVRIFVSGDLDEHRIKELLSKGGCVDSFGVGTALSTSSDAPTLGVIYKLVEVGFPDHVRPTAKFSEDKKTYPGRKQVFRFFDKEGKFSQDIIALEDEKFAAAKPLLVPVMRQGRRVGGAESPAAIAQSARKEFLANREGLSARLAQLESAEPAYPVRYSSRLEELCLEVQRKMAAKKTFAGPSKNDRVPNVLFWEVDVQADFMFPEGKLYAPGAEKIIPNINRLVDAVRRGRVFLISSADAHCLADAELRQWPPHCLKGSPGAEIIPEGRAPKRLVIPNQKHVDVPHDLSSYQQVTLEKNTLDVFDNPHTDVLLKRLLTGVFKNPEFIVFGVVTECCVRIEAEGLLRRGHPVSIVADAIQPFDPQRGESVLAELQAQGARLITTEEALKKLTPPLARAA
jgi:nicotinate phosphoribosyltransferase